MAALLGNLLTLSGQLPALAGAQLSLDDLLKNRGAQQGQGSDPGTPLPQHWGCTVSEASFASQLYHSQAK